MEYIRIQDNFPNLSDTAVTLGKFDGLHRGHRRLVKDILEKKQDGMTAVLFAFTTEDKMIFTSEERKDILEEMGMDVLIECPLTEEFRRMKPDVFIREILTGDLGASHVAVGEDFRFGHDRKGTPSLLASLGEKYGFSTTIFPKEMDGHRKISSTFIREELRHGNMEHVNSLLGEPFFLQGEIVHGAGLGGKRLLPTINQIPEDSKLLPPNGVYVSRALLDGRTFYGMTNIGYKPTVDGSFLGVETHLFDYSEDLYGSPCRLSLLHYLRPEKKFAGIDALRDQLNKDYSQVQDFIKNPLMD